MDPTPCRCCGVDWKPGQEGQRDHPQCWYVGFTKQHSFPPCFCETWAWAWTIYTRVKWRQFIRIKRGYVLFCSCLIFLEFFWLLWQHGMLLDTPDFLVNFLSHVRYVHICAKLDKIWTNWPPAVGEWGGGGVDKLPKCVARFTSLFTVLPRPASPSH